MPSCFFASDCASRFLKRILAVVTASLLISGQTASAAEAGLRQLTEDEEGPTSVQYGPIIWKDRVAISAVNNNRKTSNCGWLGCRVATEGPTNKFPKLIFTHGGTKPMDYYIHLPHYPPPPLKANTNLCVKWDDSVILSEDYLLSNQCGYYGCRVWKREGENVDTTHGNNGGSDYEIKLTGANGTVRRPDDDCIHYGDAFYMQINGGFVQLVDNFDGRGTNVLKITETPSPMYIFGVLYDY